MEFSVFFVDKEFVIVAFTANLQFNLLTSKGMKSMTVKRIATEKDLQAAFNI